MSRVEELLDYLLIIPLWLHFHGGAARMFDANWKGARRWFCPADYLWMTAGSLALYYRDYSFFFLRGAVFLEQISDAWDENLSIFD